MCDFENNMEEYKMCGEIRVAARRNSLIMTCCFCHQMFQQLQAFMRHLQLLHNDKLEFIKQATEVEVYAVEELINQSAVSAIVGCDESNSVEADGKWLSEADLSKLDEGVIPKKKMQQHDQQKNRVECDNAKRGNTVNTPIIKALQDCDVSFDLIHDLYCEGKLGAGEKESNRYDTILNEMENDWVDSDTNESVQNSIGCTQTEMVNFSKKFLDINAELQQDITMSKISMHEAVCCLESPSGSKENVGNCSKDLLEDVGDVENLLENFKISRTTKKLVEEVKNKTYVNDVNNCKTLNVEHNGKVNFNNILTKTFSLSENYSNTSKILLNGQYNQIFHSKTSGSLECGKEVVQNIGLDMQSKKLDDFEEQLKDLEDILVKDVTKGNNPIKNVTCEQISETLQQSEFEQNLKGLETNLYVGNDIFNINTNNNDPFLDLGKQLQNLEQSFNEIEKKLNAEEILKEKKSHASGQQTLLNEDLTKALTDAIDDDLDLLNIQLEEDGGEPLNEDILNLLEHELIDKETEASLEPHKEEHLTGNEIKPNENIENSEKPTVYVKENLAIKYQRTNLKAKKLMQATLNNDLLKPTNDEIIKDSKEQIKGNKLQQQQTTSVKSKVKTKLNANANNGQSKKYQRQKKTPIEENQENREVISNLKKIKNEKLTPTLNFINMDRGEKTPMEQEQLFLKQSAKTLERQENLSETATLKQIVLKTSPSPSPRTLDEQENLIKGTIYERGETTPQKEQFKKSPPIKEKQDDLNIEHEPTIIQQEIPELVKPERYPKTEEQTNKLQSNKILENSKNYANIKERKRKRTSKCLTRSNEKSSSSTKSISITPQRLRNIAIRLPRYTPDKLANILKKEEKIKFEENAKQIVQDLNLPKGISLMVVPTQRSKKKYKEYKIEETSMKISSESCSEIQKNKQIDILPPFQGNTTIQAKTCSSSNLECKSDAISCSTRKKEVLQRVQNIKKEIFKSIEKSECFTMKRQPKQELCIQNVTILPNLDDETLKPLLFPHLKKSRLDNNTPAANTVTVQANSFIEFTKNESSNNENEKYSAKTLKRKQLLNENRPVKRQQKFPIKHQNEVHEKISNVEATQLDLSESVVDFLQRDLKANHINVESLLHEDIAENACSPKKICAESTPKDAEIADDNASFIINDVLDQVNKEQHAREDSKNENATFEDINTNNSATIEDFNAAKDINLLAKFGLKIIKIPDIEDTITLEQQDEMHGKAFTLAFIYKKWPRIYKKRCNDKPTTKEEFKIIFKQMLAELTTSLNLNLSLNELKRLINLINLWYGQCLSSKFIEKRKISDSINRYLDMFNFIPKTSGCYYHCEYCDEYFSTDHKYFTHRIIHTGSPYPYACQKCFTGFKHPKTLRDHESSCNIILNIETRIVQPLTYNYDKSTSSNNKCLVCEQTFINSKLLYEHSKTHSQTVYNCAKCESIFSSAIDVKNHMAKCNNALERMVKQSKPRSQKAKAV